jgi:signal transduction histidine kinase/DNA-binding response OmpR family regulator
MKPFVYWLVALLFGSVLDPLQAQQFMLPPPLPTATGPMGDPLAQARPASDGHVWFRQERATLPSLPAYTDPIHHQTICLSDTTRLARYLIKRGGIRRLFTDHSGRLWLGLINNGLLWVDPRTLAFTPVFTQPLTVRTIDEAPNGIIWFGTPAGLFTYDPRTKRTRRYGYDGQLTNSLSSQEVKTVRVRPNGDVLVGLYNEINLLTPATGQVRVRKLPLPTPTSRMWTDAFVPDQAGNDYFSVGIMVCRITRTGLLQRIEFARPAEKVISLFIQPGHDTIPDRMSVKLLSGRQDRYDLSQLRPLPSFNLLDVQVNGTRLIENEHQREDRFQRDSTGHASVTIQEGDFVQLRFTTYAHPQVVQFRYKLAGVDASWTAYNDIYGTATYQPPPGEHLLLFDHMANASWTKQPASVRIVVRPVLWKTVWFRMLAGLVLSSLVWLFIRNARRRQKLRQELARQASEAESLRQLDEFKTRFFSNVTHEFRTPLTIILNATEQLTAKTPTHAEQPEVATIRRHAHQLLRLITQTLDMARLDADKLDTHLQLGNPIGFTGQVVAQFAGLAAQRGLTLTYNTQPALAWLYTDNDLADGAPTGGAQQYSFDGEAWEKIAYNLLANALKFTPRGGSVQVMGQVKADDRFLLVVEDTGIGIPTDQVARIFDRFHQVDDRSTRAYSGTGIGLALVRELANWLGGEVRVESQLDQGSRFTVELPLLRPDQASISEGSTAPVDLPWLQPMAKPSSAHLPVHREATSATVTDKPLVLVVEDNDDLRTQMAAYLSGDYQVLTAQNGQWGWEEATSQVPDLIVSDVMMPELDGYQLLERLKTDERTSHIPVILLTARSSAESRLQGLQLRADDYLVKPVSLVELGLRIGNGLRTRQQAQKRFLAQLNLPPPPLPTKFAPSREELFLNRLRQAILTHLASESLDVDWLAAQAQISRTQLNRKLSALTGLSPNRFIQRVRLERGAELLQTGKLTVAEVAYQIGYDSPSYFAKVFQEQFGHPPSKWRDK